MREISGDAKTIRQLLQGQRYSIDFYQREYRWQKKQVQELIEDLAEQFLASHSPTSQREDVQKYGHYFLGSVILSRRDNDVFIVDGQQRLTTISLLLILLHNQQGGRPDRVKLEELIYSERYGKRTFNIAVPDRLVVMDAIYSGQIPEVSDESESVRTIAARYADLEELFPDEIDEAALPYFCDWLIENVHLVEICATTDEDAYTIFETMNDRGLSLSPLDMLKGYLLASIRDTDKRNLAAKVWRDRIESLHKLGKDEDGAAVKAWLRARYAESVRERGRGADNKDFERIGTEFHRWVGDHAEQLGLTSSDDYFRFVHGEMAFFTKQYERLRHASEKLTPGLEPVRHLASLNFTLQYPVMLAPLRVDDSPEIIERKVRVVATFLDILLVRRAVNSLSMTYGAMSYAMFLVMKAIRGMSLEELVPALSARLRDQDCTFDGTPDGNRAGFATFDLNQWSKRYIKAILARMAAYIDVQSGLPSGFDAYLAEGKNRYEVEHVWADKFDRHKDEFSTQAEWAEYRNRLGGLLLLPKTFNASYGALSYEDKLAHYFGQNMLARSLHPKCYEHHPGFASFRDQSGLPFRSMEKFHKAELAERHALYRAIADRIWNPDLLSQQ